MDEQTLRLFSAALLDGKIPDNFPSDLLNSVAICGILTALQENGQLEAVNLLQQTAMYAVGEKTQNDALARLETLATQNNQLAIQALFQLTLDQPNPTIAQIIIKNSLHDPSNSSNALFCFLYQNADQLDYYDPQKIWISSSYLDTPNENLRQRLSSAAHQNSLDDWLEIIEALHHPDQRSLQSLVARFPQFSPANQQLILFLLERQYSIDIPPIREALFHLYFLYDHPVIAQTIQKLNILPDNQISLALYYFLSEHWEEYKQLDFNHALISMAYDTAEPSLRKRILEHSRHSGYTDWLSSGNQRLQARLSKQLSNLDWELILEQITLAGRWEDLWRLFHSAPPIWGIQILQRLKENSRILSNYDDIHALETISQAIVNTFPSPILRKSFQFPQGKLTCTAISPDGTQLAAGGENSIIRWNLDSGKQIPPPVLPPSPVVRALAFSPSGEQLAAASGNNSILIFRLNDSHLIKTLIGHQGIIRAIAIPPSGRFLYSAGFDGALLAWRFPEGGESRTLLQTPGELFSLALANNYIVTAGSQREITALSLVDGSIINKLSGHQDTVTALAISAQGPFVASAARDASLSLWNINSGRSLFQIHNLAQPLINLLIDPQERFIAASNLSGQIQIFNFSDGQLLYSWRSSRHPLVGLNWLPKSNSLVVADKEGTISSWDFELFIQVQSPAETLDLSKLTSTHTENGINTLWLQYLQEFTRWKQRYDIEIGEKQHILIGEYDIEL